LDIVIEGVEARRGEKKTGYLVVGETPVQTVRIPLAIVNGAKPGPTLCVSGGVHGCEYTSVEAVIRTIRDTDPAALSGRLLAVPVLNMTGFETRGPQGGISTPFQCPIDSLNLNRVFPGNPDGTMSYQIAAAFMSKIVSRADYYIDCHGGDLNEELIPLVVVVPGDKEQNRIAKEILAASFDCDFIIEDPLPGGSHAAATALGKPAVVVEAGGYGRLMLDAVQLIASGIVNVMRRLKMLEGSPTPTRKQRVRKLWSVHVKRGGICYSIPVGTKVKKGDHVAELRNIFGELIETVQSPIDGTVFLRRSPIPVCTNDRILAIMPEEDVPPPKPRPYP
jgi:predicted deacylase